jgi:hypothetical protein
MYMLIDGSGTWLHQVEWDGVTAVDWGTGCSVIEVTQDQIDAWLNPPPAPIPAD